MRDGTEASAETARFEAYVERLAGVLGHADRVAGLPLEAWREVTWRDGSAEALSSRFAAVQVIFDDGGERMTTSHVAARKCAGLAG